MGPGFVLSCESTIDLPYSYCEARGIPVLFYSYQVDGVSYEDDKGRIIAYDKVRGKKNAVARTVETMKRHAENGENYAGKAFICHSNCLADAEAAKAAVEAAFPHLNGKVRICDIGTIVASHSGPGTVAVFFFGDDRAPEGSPV